jgi:hypothetical protein
MNTNKHNFFTAENAEAADALGMARADFFNFFYLFRGNDKAK